MTRKATEDCEVSNLRIPRGMGVQINMEAVHHDPDLWGPEDPNDFVPERLVYRCIMYGCPRFGQRIKGNN